MIQYKDKSAVSLSRQSQTGKETRQVMVSLAWSYYIYSIYSIQHNTKIAKRLLDLVLMCHTDDINKK